MSVNFKFQQTLYFLFIFVFTAFIFIACGGDDGRKAVQNPAAQSSNNKDDTPAENTPVIEPDSPTSESGLPAAESHSYDAEVSKVLFIYLKDSDSDGSKLNWKIVQEPEAGTAILEDTKLRYSAPSETGSFIIKLSASDNSGKESIIKTITFTVVEPVVNAPVVDSQNLNVVQNGSLSITLTADKTPIEEWSISSNPMLGQLEKVASGKYNYIAGGVYGNDFFTVKAKAEGLLSIETFIYVQIKAKPSVFPQNEEVLKGDNIEVILIGNDPDGTIETWEISEQPPKGTASISNGVLRYEAPLEFAGKDIVKVVAKDNEGFASDPADIIFNVIEPDADAPSADPKTVNVYVDNSIQITLTGSPGESGEAISYWKIVEEPSKGTAQLTNPLTGMLEYNAGSESGFDVFKVKAVNTLNKESISASISVSIKPLPIALSKTVEIQVNESKQIPFEYSNLSNIDFQYTSITKYPQYGTYIKSETYLEYNAPMETVTDIFKFKGVNNDGFSGNEATITIKIIPPLTFMEKLCGGEDPRTLTSEISKHPFLKYYDFTSVEQVKCRYVTNVGSITAGGTSWDDAYGVNVLRDPTQTISDASPSKIYLLLVKAGLYKPTDDLSRSASFNLKDYIPVIGGFKGTGFEFEGNTILSGDLKEDDISDIDINSASASERMDNSYHVVKASGENPLFIANIEITGANASGSSSEESMGGGFYALNNTSGTIVKGRFIKNTANNLGAGFYAKSGKWNFISSAFNNNAGREGSALYINESELSTIRSTEISNNFTLINGAIFFKAGNLEVESSLISYNQAKAGGGAYFEDSNVNILTSTFIYNSVTESGGGIYQEGGKLSIISSSIIDNSSDGQASAISYVQVNESNYLNSVIVNNNVAYNNPIPGFKTRLAFSYLENYTDTATLGSNYKEFDRITEKPVFGDLANHGGEVNTISPISGSSAIDKGTYAGFDVSGNLCFQQSPDGTYENMKSLNSVDLANPDPCTIDKKITSDGRGFGFNNLPDIGAHEFMGIEPNSP